MDLALGKTYVGLIGERLNLQIKLQEARERLAQLPEFQLVRDLEVQFHELEEQEEKKKDEIMFSMIATGTDKISLPEAGFEFKLKKNPPSVVIEDESMIPDQYKKEKVTVTIDKKAIKDEISKGGIVRGCHIESGTKLLINKI